MTRSLLLKAYKYVNTEVDSKVVAHTSNSLTRELFIKKCVVIPIDADILITNKGLSIPAIVFTIENSGI